MRRSCRYFLFLLFISSMAYSQFDPVPSFFRTQREVPLIELNTTQTILVSDYGANVNDGTNDIPGITAAITAAVNLSTLENPVRLVFESGTYDLMPTSGSHAISMANAKGVLWDGQNAEFIVHNPTIGFLSLFRCTNTILKDFSVDYATLPFTQGKITKVDVANGNFQFKLDDGYPLPIESHFVNAPQRWGMIKNSKGGIKEGTPNLISHNRYFESVGTRTYLYGNQNANNLTNIEVGDYFVHIARYNGATIIRNTAGKNLTYLNITGYTSPAGGFNARDSEEWNVINCQLKLKDNRVHTTNADAMHVNGGKIGPWVENSLFEGFSDDFMNIKYTRRGIKNIHSSTEITVEFEVAVGENIEFYNPREGEFLGAAVINNVQNLGSNLYKITLSNAINITTINNDDNQLADKAYIESRSNESMIFRNNVVRNSRRYGILIQSKYALIENNTFQNLSGAAIRIENGVDWGEGFRADHIEIRNNRIENCGYDKTYIEEPNSAAISVDFSKVKTPCSSSGGFCGTETSAFRAHSNIRIIDNTILYNKRGLYLKNIQGLTLANNFLCHRDEDITLINNQNPVEQVIFNTGGQNITNYNYDTPDADLQFLLNESSNTAQITNTGVNQGIELIKQSNGGAITQGFFDNEVGYTIKFDTEGNGNLMLINASDANSFPGASGGAARSYAFWVKPEKSIFQTILYSGGPADGEVFAIQMEANGMLRVTDNNGNFIWMQDMLLDIGQWNHIAVTVPENNSLFSIQLYKNGIPSNETKMGNNALINTASNMVQFFPRFKGIASDIRYVDYKLCGSEVERIYNDRQVTLSNDDLTSGLNELKVYPTIVSDFVHFSKSITSIQVINVLGKTLISKKRSRLSKLNLARLTSGLYILRINNTKTIKIYKN